MTVWVVAGAFFAVVGVRVAQDAGARAPITSPTAAAITAAYSVGGACLLLGAAAVVLPRDRRSLALSAYVWIAVTAMLLVTRLVSGIPLIVASCVATLIALDVVRRLARAIVDAVRQARAP